MPRPGSPPKAQQQRQRTLQDSQADQEAIANEKEWERLLVNAKAEADRKDAELARERARAAELERELRQSQVGLAPAGPPAATPASPGPKVEADPDDPKALRLRSRWGSLVVPIAWITAAATGIGAPLAAAVQHVVKLQADVATLSKMVANLQTEVAALKDRRHPPANR